MSWFWGFVSAGALAAIVAWFLKGIVKDAVKEAMAESVVPLLREISDKLDPVDDDD